MKIKLYLFIASFLFFFIITGGHLYSPDEEILFRTTQSLATHANFAIDPLLGFASRKGIDGNQYAQYGIGQPILATPLFFLGTLLDAILPDNWIADSLHNTTQYHDRSSRNFNLRFAFSLFNPIITALTCLVLYSFCFYITEEHISALLTSILYGFSTIAAVHSKTFFTEPLASLLILSAFYFLFRAIREKKFLLILLSGSLFGYALLTRNDSIFALPAFLTFIALENFYLFLRSTKKPSKNLKNFALAQVADKNKYSRFAFFLPVLLFICIILILNWARFGSPFSSPYLDQPEGLHFSTPLLAGLYGFLFSIGKGLFFFSPPLILFFFSINKFLKRDPSLAISTLTLIIIFLLIQSKWQNWTGGWCWGPRHIFQIHVFLALPICLLLTSPRKPSLRVFFSILLLIGFLVQIYGASQNFIDFYLQFYRTPQSSPSAHVLFSQDDTLVLDNYYQLFFTPNPTTNRRVPLWSLVAPLNDSIYIPQNSQWNDYAKMLADGKHDFFWLKTLF